MISQITDRLSMHLFFDKLYSTLAKRPPLKAIILLSDLQVSDLQKILDGRSKLSRLYSLKIAPLEEHLYKIYLKKIIRKKIVKGYFLLDTKQKGVWIAFTNAQSYFVTRVMEKFFDELYPDISRLFLNYSQIRALLQTIKGSYDGKTTMTFFTIRREPRTERPFLREPGTLTLWEHLAEEELTEQSKNYRVMVDRLSFEVRDQRNAILLQAHVTRRGLCKLKFGNFSAFFENVVLNAINLGMNWKKFYSKRERSVEDGEIKLRPFQIGYDFNIGKEQLYRLGDELSKSYSCSIVHKGNPYFVANICDYYEGSSFGVTVLGKIVTITPITRASTQAVWKLTNRIQELLGDGEIVEVGRASE